MENKSLSTLSSDESTVKNKLNPELSRMDTVLKNFKMPEGKKIYRFQKEKLTPEQRMMMVKLHAEGYASEDIQEYIKERWGIEYSGRSVQTIANLPAYKDFYLECREKYYDRVKDVPIANKRIRLDRLEKISIGLLERMRNGDNERAGIYCMYAKTLVEIINSAREEMERRPSVMAQFNQYNMFSGKSDKEIRDRNEEIIREAERLITGKSSGAYPGIEGTTGEATAEPA